VLDVVEVGEFAAGVGRDELVEFIPRLRAEAGAIDQEEDALCPGVFDEAVGRGAGGEGLAGAGGHLDERARFRLGEGLLEVCDAFHLAVTHAGGGEGMSERQLCQTRSQGGRCLLPLRQRLGEVE